MSILQRLAKAFEQAFGYSPEKFSIDTVPDDISKWDSIGHMRLVASLETEFDIHFEIDEIMEMASALAIMNILKTKGITD